MALPVLTYDNFMSYGLSIIKKSGKGISMARGKKSGGFNKWNGASRDDIDNGGIDRALREMAAFEQSRQKPIEHRQPIEKRQPPSQIVTPTPSLNGNPLQNHFLTHAFASAGYVNWVGDLVKLPWLSQPGNVECAIRAKKEEDGWKITRHSRFMGQARWQKQIETVSRDIDPIIIKNALVAWAVKAGEEINTFRRMPEDLSTGSELTLTNKEWPYLTPVFKNAGRVLMIKYKQYEMLFDYHDDTPCALLVRPSHEERRWEITRHQLLRGTLRPEEPRLLPEGIQHSQVLDAVVSWSRAAKNWSKGEFIIPHDKLKELSAMLLVDTRITPDQTGEALNPPSR
ncbi:MAG: hypothetical protein KA155_00950 [Alphaproteobacteria bacterium]|jgi:hypothetical protein|nr:hypothetical protein [Alphaproteobacteria bacterium]